MGTFVDDVGEEQERSSPVRAAVKSAAADIQAARQAGKPLNAIFRTLKRKGLKVGAGYSSFRNAVVHLDKYGWPDGAAEPSTPPTPVARDRFVDDRHDSDF